MIISQGMKFIKYVAHMVAVINAFWSAKEEEERGLRGGWIMGIKMDHNEIKMGGF